MPYEINFYITHRIVNSPILFSIILVVSRMKISWMRKRIVSITTDQPLGQRPGGHHLRRKRRHPARHREPDGLLSVRYGGAGKEL